MVAIPDYPEQRLSDLVWQAREREQVKKSRGIYLSRLGASTLGEACQRAAFFDWRAYARGSTPGRVLNLFETGHIVERRVVEDLRLAGMRVWDLDPATGKQFTYADPETGHSVCKLDGVIKGVPGFEDEPHVLEIKSHNDKNFASLVKRRVREAFPTHYVQCQEGMWLTGLRAALYVGRNKNDESYHFERVPYDEAAVAEGVKGRIRSLYGATLIPAGVSPDATGYLCKWCGFKDVCTGGQPLKNCRTCRSCEPGPDGSWLCNLWEKTLDWDEQRAACDRWDPLKAEPVK